MKTVLAAAMLVALAALGGASLVTLIFGPIWHESPASGIFSSVVDPVLFAVAVIGGIAFWLDRRRRDD